MNYAQFAMNCAQLAMNCAQLPMNYAQLAIEPRCSQLATPDIDRPSAPFDRTVREYPGRYTGVASWVHRVSIANYTHRRL
jgi:hypothetical protein